MLGVIAVECRWHSTVQNLISAAAGILGVLVGGLMTGWVQKRDRQNARIHEQLLEFYSPLRAIRTEIQAKSELRSKLHSTSNALWQSKFVGVNDPQAKAQIQQEDWPRYEQLAQYSDEQLKNELLPLYRSMLQRFSTHMGLAELSTLDHYPALVKFVEIWNRFLQNSIPPEVINAIGHSEEMLIPLYEDIEQNFKSLNARLKR